MLKVYIIRRTILEIIREVSITDNDIYAMSISKDYIIINYNYMGLRLYDKELKFVKDIVFSQELIVYSVYTSILNNNVVIIDAENSKLYILIIGIDNYELLEINQDNVFSEYFMVENSNFLLAKENIVYKYSYKTGNLINTYVMQDWSIIFNCQNEFLFRRNNKIFYKRNCVEYLLAYEYREGVFYKVFNEVFVEYDESKLKIYRKTNLIDTYLCEESFIIRTVNYCEGRIIVLLNKKSILNVSTICQIKI